MSTTSTFGAGTGLAITATGAVLQGKTSTPLAQNTADALDEYGDIVDRAFYGVTGVEEVQETYAIKGDISSSDLPTLGKVTLGPSGSSVAAVVTNIEVSTSNSDWPQVSVTYRKGMAANLIEPGAYTMPTFTIVGKRIAQLIGLSGVTNVQSGSFSANCEIQECLDATGTQCKYAFTTGAWEANAEYLDGTPAVATGFDGGHLEEAGAETTSNTAWATKSAKASGYLAVTGRTE